MFYTNVGHEVIENVVTKKTSIKSILVYSVVEKVLFHVYGTPFLIAHVIGMKYSRCRVVELFQIKCIKDNRLNSLLGRMYSETHDPRRLGRAARVPR